MERLRHLFPQGTSAVEDYAYPHRVGGGEFAAPPRDRAPHAELLLGEIRTAEEAASAASAQQSERPKGLVLDFRSDPGFKLKLESLEARQEGIELRSARIDETGVMQATVFIPEGKTSYFIKRLEQYAAEETKKGNPRHQALIESISEAKLATLESFWRDAGAFPSEVTTDIWWEVWLADLDPAQDVAVQFRDRASQTNVLVADRELSFPERRVVLARGTAAALARVPNLFDLLAELRLAKLLAGEFLTLTPTDQAEFVQEALQRLRVVQPINSSVCHLDTGVNRGHPLLEPAIAAEHVLAVDPNWSGADVSGHGTEMAGLALYGCLTEVLGGAEPIELRHCIESVKILPDGGAHDPNLWGHVTIQSAARIEIVAPERSRRVFSLTVTAEGRDEGAPSSWSAAIDQLCAGDDASGPRLLIVAAGNLPLEDRHEYPARNFVSGVEDPAQSWNALTVGAFTELASVGQTAYSGWQAVAPAGGLSPSSRTSRIWPEKGWPIKPDILMEGGNVAINPATQRADFVDDLSLLTTKVSVAGGMLTSTADTSAATALAARFAARLWAAYPSLRPGTIRGLMVHSARWTPQMVELADGSRETLLRCCGYGVPNYDRACWSASNAATLVIESSLQPYRKTAEGIKSHEMHFHRLPWPTEVLQGLLDERVRMRVTLSYFVEPSPGRRGWNRKHRYQSHGLRFKVKRPEQTIDEFRKQITKSARDVDEEIENISDDREWEIGSHLRCKGSIHSDTWEGTAAQLAASGLIAVFPVTGWWRERPHLKRFEQRAAYSLIASIETEAEGVDLYTPIANAIAATIPS